MRYLAYILDKISKTHPHMYPLPDDMEAYFDKYIPNKDIPLDTYQKVFKLSAEDLERVYKEGYQAYLQGEYEESSTAFYWLVFFNPFVSKFWLSLGASLHMRQKYPQALHAYGVAALLREKDPYPHYYAYVCYTLLNNPEEAEKALDLAWQKAKLSSSYNALKEEILAIKSYS